MANDDDVIEAMARAMYRSQMNCDPSDEDLHSSGDMALARAALAAAKALGYVRVTEGWQIVPKEPTDRMMEAYCEKLESLAIHAWANASVIWPVMLSAAPHPKEGGEG